jgi:hypothetical protein
MKNKHEYGNQPEGYSELEEEIAEDVIFKNDNKNAKSAFLNDQQHEAAPGNAMTDRVQTTPPLEGVEHTDFVERRDTAIKDRRNSVTVNLGNDAGY